MADAAILLYDGHCRLCTAGSSRLRRWAAPGRVLLQDFQEAGVLDRFPGLTHQQCMRAVHLVCPDGRVLRAAEAVVAVLLTRGAIFGWARLYYLPGLRTLVDVAYAWVARNRYRLMGRKHCADGACALHLGP